MSSYPRQPVRRIPVPGAKDDTGAFVPEPKDFSIDALMKQGLEAIHGVMKGCLQAAKSGSPSREDVQNLKDCLSMLKDLKEQEKDLLDDLTDEELEKVATK